MIKNEFQIVANSDDKSALDLLEETFLAKGLSLSRQEIKSIMQKGCVWLQNNKYTQRVRRAKKIIKKGETLFCYYNEEVLAEVPPKATLVSDEGDYSIWNKPSGMLSQGSKWGDHCTINRWAEKHLSPERPAFIVHRLDKAASGLILVAHKKKIAAQFAQMFKNREIEKHYSVKVEGNFSKCANFDSDVITLSEELDGKAAISHVRFIQYDVKDNTSLLDVAIETGRKHQIRKHMSGLGYPVVGDRLYGLDKNSVVDLQLTAKSLKFECPVEKVEKNYNY